MRIIVISLKTEHNRRCYIDWQMKNTGLRFEFFDALTPDDVTTDQLQTMMRHATGPTLMKHIGCCLSHQYVWKIIAEGTEPVAILEDDVYISSSLPNVLTEICSMILPNEVYDIEFFGRKHLIARTTHWVKNIGQSDECSAKRCYVNKTGAAGYAIDPNTAKKLVLEAKDRFVLVDSWLYSRPWLKCYLVEPMPVVQSEYTRCQSFHETKFNLGKTSNRIGPARWAPRSRFNRLINKIEHLPAIIQSIGESTYQIPLPASDLLV